jgi:ubiquinone/menaquinone biosynthesis C-methylase UbiE
MKKRGWEVYGLDFDPRAAEAARSEGLSVQYGKVECQGYPSEFFDAVTLNHVIEHIPDPCKTLKECLRVLKPGGRLIIVTPNGTSLGHLFFGRHWRGIEAPRHLHIFSFESIKRALQLEMAKVVILKPQVVKSLPCESFLMRWGRNQNWPAGILDYFARLFTFLFNCLEQSLLWYRPSVADCVTVIALKD